MGKTLVSFPFSDEDSARIVPHLLIALIHLTYDGLITDFDAQLERDGVDRELTDDEKRRFMNQAVRWAAERAVPRDIGEKMIEDIERIVDDLMDGRPLH